MVYAKSFDEAAKVGVTYSRYATCSLGRILDKTQSWEESLECTSKCVNGHKYLYQVWRSELVQRENIGKIYNTTKRHDKAEEVFLETTKINPDDKSIN
mmetsp:Transcript_15972/g.22239  ORF Transcript_15972/g.22239 Transcript_15972/m.22239 type:complete len:98 (+) Transcript_15972:7-300(+)